MKGGEMIKKEVSYYGRNVEKELNSLGEICPCYGCFKKYTECWDKSTKDRHCGSYLNWRMEANKGEK